MECPKCQKIVNHDIKFCPQCGFNFQQESEQIEQVIEERQQYRTKKKSKVLPIILSVFVLGLGVYGAWRNNLIQLALNANGNISQKSVSVYPYEDAFGLSILDENLDVIKQNVGANTPGFVSPVSYSYAFDKFGVAVVKDQNYVNWLINTEGEVISMGSELLNVHPISAMSGYEERVNSPASFNGVHASNHEEIGRLIDSNGEVKFEIKGGILPFYQMMVTVFTDYQPSTSNYSDAKSGVVDDKGEVIIPATYAEIRVVDNDHFIVRQLAQSDKHYLINRSEEIILEFESSVYPSILQTESEFYIGATDIYGNTHVYKEDGSILLSVDYETTFFLSQDGQYIYSSPFNNDQQQFRVYTIEGEVIFEGMNGTSYSNLNAENWLSYHNYEGFGYIDLDNRESTSSNHFLNINSFSFIGQSTIGKLLDSEGNVSFYNAQLEEIYLPDTIGISAFIGYHIGDYVLIHRPNGASYALDSKGSIISDDVKTLIPDGKVTYIQELSGRAYLIESSSGQILKENN